MDSGGRLMIVKDEEVVAGELVLKVSTRFTMRNSELSSSGAAATASGLDWFCWVRAGCAVPTANRTNSESPCRRMRLYRNNMLSVWLC